MAVYNNFLTTPYESNGTLLLGTLANYKELTRPNKAFIVYCDPKNVDYSDILTLADAPYELSFQNQYISNKIINLFDIFNSLKTYTNNVSSFTQFVDDISIQKFFYPFYQSLMYKTVFSNIITADDLLTQIDLYYGKQLTFTDIQSLDEKKDEINIIINYDLYCPYYEYPIRFVFQNIVKIP